MAPEFFALLGLRAQGSTFELMLWSAVAVAGAAFLDQERRAQARGTASVGGWLTAVLVLALGAYRVWAVTAQAALFFGQAGLTVGTYGVLFAVGFAVGLGVVARENRRVGPVMTGAAVLDLGFWVLIGGLLGARALGWLTTAPEALAACRADPDSLTCGGLWRVWEGPLVFLGGVLGAAAGAALWGRSRGARFSTLAYLVAPSIPLGHAIGRLGCLAAGCCYGARTQAPGAITYPLESQAFAEHYLHGSALERSQLTQLGHSFAVHPVQLYEAGGDLLLFALLVSPLGARLGGPRRLAGWAIGYGLLRLVTELLRGDSVRGFVVTVADSAAGPVGLSTSQALAVALISGGLAAWRKGGAAAPPQPPVSAAAT